MRFCWKLTLQSIERDSNNNEENSYNNEESSNNSREPPHNNEINSHSNEMVAQIAAVAREKNVYRQKSSNISY